MEAVVNVSLQPSVLDAAVMSYAMLTPGQDVTGTVRGSCLPLSCL